MRASVIPMALRGARGVVSKADGLTVGRIQVWGRVSSIVIL